MLKGERLFYLPWNQLLHTSEEINDFRTTGDLLKVLISPQNYPPDFTVAFFFFLLTEHV